MTNKQILKLVEGETRMDLKTKTGKRKYAIPRGIYFNLAYEFAEDGTYEKIGEEVGYDHVTVLYWRRKLPQHLPYEPEYKHIYYKLRRNLRSGSFEEAEALIMDEQAEEVLTQMITV
jgi:chromosomal replication initiation ATPase DnaA